MLSRMFSGGVWHFLYVLAFSVLLPMYTIQALNHISVQGVDLSFGQTNFDLMIAWLYRTGVVMAAVAFFKAFSPKYSKRRVWGNLFQNITYVFYIYMYKFSGTSNITMQGSNVSIVLNIDSILVLYMGLVFLYILASIYEIIDTALWCASGQRMTFERKLKKSSASTQTKWREAITARFQPRTYYSTYSK